MRVFLTGASGFVGTAIIDDLTAAGHQVIGLARSDASAQALAARGVGVHRGDVTDPARLVAGVALADAVIHCAFNHDFSQYMQAGEDDLRAVEAMAGALAGSGRPLVVTSGLTAGALGRPGTEDDPADLNGSTLVRGRPETRTLEFAAEGVRAMIVRLPPSVHDVGAQGLVSPLMMMARGAGRSVYIGEGANRWAAVHRRDAARVFRLALEQGEAGRRYHAVGEEGVPLKAIAQALGRGLGVPTVSVTAQEAAAGLGFFAGPLAGDVCASSEKTRADLGWSPQRPGLLEGLAGPYLI